MHSRDNDSIVVLFSGGSDSTLAAVFAAQEFGRVYLVSYSHRLMFFHEKIKINISKLKEQFPRTQFIHLTEDISQYFRTIYLARFLSYLRTYKTILVPWICGACSLSMHLKTIELCRKSSIRFVYCGANKESRRIFPSQMSTVIADIKALYKRYGISYEAPVYDVDRSDHTLHDMGIIANRKLKDQHLIYSTQHSCPLGVLLHAHSRLYYSRIWGNDRYQKQCREMMRLKITEATAHFFRETDHEYPRCQ